MKAWKSEIASWQKLQAKLGTEDKEAQRVYEMLGMPETALSESRRANEIHHMMSLVGALRGVGQLDRAVELAQWSLKLANQMGIGDKDAWAYPLAVACYESVLGDTDAALAQLEKLPALQTIVWLPFLKDLACLQNLAGEPRYQLVVQVIEQRLAAIRARLPNAMQEQGFAPADLAQK